MGKITWKNFENLKNTLNEFKIAYDNFIYWTNNQNKQDLKNILENIEDIYQFYLQKTNDLISDWKNKICFINNIKLEWTNKMSELELKVNIWFENDEERKKIFSEIRTIKEKFSQANVELPKIPYYLSTLDSILNKISQELESCLNSKLNGNKAQECDKAIIKLISFKEELSKIDFNKLQEINDTFDKTRNEFFSSIKHYEKLCREHFSSKIINNAQPNCINNKTPQKNSCNNCL